MLNLLLMIRAKKKRFNIVRDKQTKVLGKRQRKLCDLRSQAWGQESKSDHPWSTQTETKSICWKCVHCFLFTSLALYLLGNLALFLNWTSLGSVYGFDPDWFTLAWQQEKLMFVSFGELGLKCFLSLSLCPCYSLTSTIHVEDILLAVSAW